MTEPKPSGCSCECAQCDGRGHCGNTDKGCYVHEEAARKIRERSRR